jgi:eukaryotic-like serine/threonine-protein kinase
MFKDEAKITVQLTHANIAQVYEFDEVTIGSGARNFYIAMEYVSGRDLRAIFEICRKKGEPAPVQLTCYALAKLCEGLDYAHRKKDSLGRDMNVVHRDVSPQNVLVSYEGEVKIIDFGIAKAVNKATKTQAGIIKGKFAYMSPEQIRGLPLDRRSDVFAIGVCLWEMLAGQRLFVGDSDFAVLEKVRKAEVAPPSSFNRRVPEALDRIVLKALAKDVDARFHYASDLGDELQRFLITQETIFSRKDLMQYMKSTFAEDLEREKLRLQDYGQIKAPAEMLEAIERSKAMAPIPLTERQQLSRPGPPPPAGAPLMGTPGWNGGGPAPDADVVLGETLVYDRSTGSRWRANATPRPSGQGAIAGATPGSSSPLPLVLGDTGATYGTFDPLPRPGAQVHGAPPQTAQSARSTGTWTAPQGTPGPAGERLRTESIADGTGPAPAPTAVSSRRSGARLGAAFAIAVVVLSAATAGAWVAFREFAEGVLYIDVPEALRGKARVNLDGRDLGPAGSLAWPLVQRTLAGPRTLVITAEGWKPFTTTVEVNSGRALTEVRPRMEPVVEIAQLVLGLDPVEAEVLIDGRTVKNLGDPHAPYVGELVVGKPATLEVRMPGYKLFTRTLSADSATAPVRLTATLDPVVFRLRVTSEPPGAQIRVAGRELGETPAEIAVPLGTTELALSMKCFDELVVPINLPAVPGDPLEVPGKLERRPGCR